MNDFFYRQEASITVCDENGIVIYQNEKSKNTFSDVIGKSLYDCHPPHAAEKIKAMLQDGKPNSYTISKNGVKKLIYQTPWRDSGNGADSGANGADGGVGCAGGCTNGTDGAGSIGSVGDIKGLIEYSMVIPEDMPHYVRGNS